jgi:Sulfotransferase family
VLYPGWRADARGPLEVVCANQWVTCNDQAAAAFENIHPGRRTSVRYEDLVDHPMGEIERLMSWLDLPLEPAVRARAEAIASTPINVVTPPEAGKWRRENPKEIEAVSSRLQSTMKALGYE